MFTLRAAALAVMATTALAGNVLNVLPSCWDDCSTFVSGKDCSWYDASCICDLANTSNYLSATIQCAKATCKSDWDSSDINRFLAPIEFTCSLVGGVNQPALNGAQSAASVATVATSATAASSTTTAMQTTAAAETTLRATVVRSSSTAVIDQPLSFGSEGVSSGVQSTSILVSTINIIPVPASTTSSEEVHTTTQGGIVQATGTLTSTPAFEPASGSETTTSSSAAATTTSEPGGGGTLFDSTSDGSSNSLAGLVIAAYVVAVAVIHAL